MPFVVNAFVGTLMNIIHCPIKGALEVQPCDAHEITPLLDHLQADLSVAQETVFPRGTVTPDGRLDLCKQNLGPQGCRLVTRALEGNTCVVSLLLGTDGIGNEGAHDVAQLIERNAHLEIVYLGCNGIQAPGAITLAQSLTGNSSIVGLWLKRNPIGPEGARALAQMLRYNTTLRTLDLVNTAIGSQGLSLLLDVLRQENHTLERLYLGGNCLGRRDAEALAALLHDNQSLRALLLNVNALGDDGMESLAEGLRANRTLRELGLASNGLTARGAQYLVGALRVHPTLSILDLGWSPSTKVLGATPNTIGDEGAAAIGAMLRDNSVLTRLDLRHNGISQWGCHALADGLEGNTTLQYLMLDTPLHTQPQALLERNRAEASPQQPSRDVTLIRSVYRTKAA
jgi:Ran GTPase-activating protein (RanGAP) involved in mRNA processing and transport